jgi:hypothetical protein
MPPKVISGISSCFQLLFQCQGQVAHVLLTRSPLVYPRRGLTVRLACVKHAASVRPEPGSNSPLKSIQKSTLIESVLFVSTRLIADKKTHAGSMSINQRNPNSDHAPKKRQGASSEHGVFVHYLALTFSTLLSSQVSGAHRAGTFRPGLGQLIYIRSAITPSQIGASPSMRRHDPIRGEPLRGAPVGSRRFEFLRVGRCS